MVNEFHIAGHTIGANQPCFIIAEAGVNHNGDLDLALRLIDCAAEAGADAIKFQTFKAEKLASPQAPKADYQIRNTGRRGSQLNMLKKLELSAEQHRILIGHCQQVGILFLSSAFDESTADLLDQLGVAAFKLGSGELTNLPLLVHIARKHKPMILSTGMANLGEVEQAVEIVQQNGNDNLVLLHCVSNYPAEAADINLRAMHTLSFAFNHPVGYSDHTIGLEIPFAAVALGACVVEKHITLDRSLPGPDQAISAEPQELISLVKGIRLIESALGDGIKRPSATERDTMAAARKSLIAACDVKAGARLTADNVVIRRPGTGIPPAMLPYIIGRTASHIIPAGTPISLEDLE